MSKITCQCGHENPFGTVLCEKCGRPLTEEAKQKETVDMRYEGSARRSQTYNKSLVDKVWNFFSSVKVGIGIIITVLITSAIGTLFPQKMYVPASTDAEYAAYYERLYGFAGKLYYNLGFYDMYSSWWFKILIGMLGTSIIIASLDRVIPLYKSLKKQRTKRHSSFMKRQRVYGEGTVENSEKAIEQSIKELKKLKYKVKTEDGAILAEKNRFSRWGPYVNHTGLIIFLLGILLRGLPGFYVDETMWIREGDTLAIPGAPGYYIKSEKFILENYSAEDDNEVFEEALQKNMIAKNYQTDVSLYKDPVNSLPGQHTNLEFVKKESIIVNYPLKFDGYNIFQMDYRLDELKSMTFQLTEKATEKSLGEFTVDLTDPAGDYDLGNGASVELREYVADYDGIEDGEMISKSPIPNNPAFVFKMNTPAKPAGEISFVAIRQTLEAEENDYKVNFVSADTRNISGLTIRKDKTLWILLVGGVIFMIGVTQGSYWNHRRIWIQTGEEPNTIRLAAHTNKNWYYLKREVEQVQAAANLPVFEDRESSETSLENEKGDFS